MNVHTVCITHSIPFYFQGLWAVCVDWECTSVCPGTESLVIIRSWVEYIDYFEDRRYEVNPVFVLLNK